MLQSVEKRMKAMNIEVSFSEELISMIAKEGFDPTYGARPLRRAIQTKVEDFLAEKMLEGVIKAPCSITVDYDGEKTIVK